MSALVRPAFSRALTSALLLPALLFASSCAHVSTSDAPLAALPKPARAIELARQTSDPVEAVDLAWMAGNDRTLAHEFLDRGLESSPARTDLRLRRALLAEVELDDALLFETLLAIYRESEEPAGVEAALSLLYARLERFEPWHDSIQSALSRAAPKAGSALTANLRGLVLARLARRALDPEGEARALEQGGWLTRYRSLGPLAPYFVASLFEATSHEQSGLSKDAHFRGRALEPRSHLAPQGSLQPDTDGQAGLYVSESYFEISPEAADEPLSMHIQVSGPARVRIDDQVVFERLDVLREGPRAQTVTIALSSGWHRTAIASLASTSSFARLAIMSKDGRTVLVATSDRAPPSWNPSLARARRLTPERRGEALFESLQQRAGERPTDVLFARVLGATLLMGGHARDIDHARALLRPAVEAALESAWIIQADAGLMLAEGRPRVASDAEIRLALELDPTNPRLLLDSARSAGKSEPDRALTVLRQLEQLAPKSSAPDLLAFQIHQTRGWPAEAEAALRAAMAKKVTSGLLSTAARFFRAQMRVAEAKSMEEAAAKLRGASLNWERAKDAVVAGDLDTAVAALIEEGGRDPASAAPWLRIAELEMTRERYEAALAAAKQARTRAPEAAKPLALITSNAARLGDHAAAFEAIAELRALGYQDLDLESFAADILGRRVGEPAPGSALAKALAVDALELARRPPDPRWAGYARAHLLDRTVDYVRGDGHALSMRHSLVRLYTKAATDRAGEFQLPSDSLALALRTIKPDGRIVDVDQHSGKQDLSFSALASGDVIEKKWLAIDEPATPWGGYVRYFYFRDDVPNARSELVVVVPKGTKVWWHAYHGAPEAKVEDDGDQSVYTWRALDIPALTPEPASAPYEEFIPFVCVAVGTDVDDARWTNRARFVGLTQSSWEIDRLARHLVEGQSSPSAQLLSIFDWVVENIRNGPQWNPTLALASRRGQRSTLATALLRAAGLRAELVLARAGVEGTTEPETPNASRYSKPLVRVALDGGTGGEQVRWLDFGSGGNGNPPAWVGKAPPGFRGGSYLFTSFDGRDQPVPFSDDEVEEWTVHSTVELDIDHEGNARGSIVLDFPGQIAVALKEALRPMRQSDLDRAFQGLVSAFLAGAQLEALELGGLMEQRGQLSIAMKIQAPAIMLKEGSNLVWNRFFQEPIALRLTGFPGLERLITVPVRETPLLLPEAAESLRVELRFPEGTTAPVEGPNAFDKQTDWASWTQKFEWNASERSARFTRLQSVRAHRVPVAEFGAFRELVQEIALRSRTRLIIPVESVRTEAASAK